MKYPTSGSVAPQSIEAVSPHNSADFSARDALRATSRERTRAVLKRLTARSGPAWVVYDGRHVQVKLLGTSDGLDGESLRWETSEAVGEGPIKLMFFGPSAGYQAVLQSRGDRAGALQTSLPTDFESLRFRRDPRFPAPGNVVLSRSDGAAHRASYELLNLSDRGLSFALSNNSAELRVGDRFDANVTWMDALRIRLSLTVRHVTPGASGDLRVVGAALTFFDSEDETRWHEQVDGVRHSLTRAGKLFTRDMWELFDSAGYFGLSKKSTAEFVQHRRAFERVSQLLSAHSEMGVQVVFPSMRGIEATASVIAESEQTAVVYHVAKRAGDDPRGISGKIVLRSVYEHALTWATRRSVKWVSAWVQDVTRFSCGLHRDFCALHSDVGHAGVFTFRALELAARADVPLPAGYTVRAATAAELPVLLERFWQSYPQPIPEARAWTEAALGEPHLRSDSTRSAPRDRRVTVAVRDGQITAAAIAERALPGLHLFGIFDSVYTVCLDEENTEHAVQALLANAAGWYHEGDKPHFVYACPSLVQTIEGARDLGVTHESIFSIDLMSKFLEHLWQLTAEGA
jgi:hypothetical protein